MDDLIMVFQPKWKNPSGTPTYNSWGAMRHRCLFPNDIGYSRYGGRGIGIDPAWIDDYDQFVTDMGLRPEGMTIERIDNNKNYEPNNCRWATCREQSSNTRTNKKLTFAGKTQTQEEWARELGWSDTSVITYRISKGEPIDRVLTRSHLVELAKHGSRAKYNQGCRCDLCRTEENEYRVRKRAERKRQSRMHYDL